MQSPVSSIKEPKVSLSRVLIVEENESCSDLEIVFKLSELTVRNLQIVINVLSAIQLMSRTRKNSCAVEQLWHFRFRVMS